MENNLKNLLEEFLDPEVAEPIVERAKKLELTTKVKKLKGRWHRETLRKLIKDRGNHCESCDTFGGKPIKLTLDHIIPRKILLDMSLEEYYKDEINLQILCARCNGKKASQLDFSNPKTIALLEKYIALYKQQRLF